MGGFLKNKRVVLIALIVILVAAASAAVYYFSSGKSAREFYFKAESKNYRLYADWIKKNYTDFMQWQQPYLTSGHKSRTELVAEVSSKDAKPFGINNAQGIFDVLKRCKLIFDTKYNPAGKTSLSEISLLLEKTPFADAQIFTKDRRMYFTVPVLTPDRYFTLDMDKIDEVYDRFGVPVKPQRTVNSADIAKTLIYDPDELDKGASALGDFIAGIIGEGDVRFGGSKEISLSDKKAVGREVLVKLDGKKSSELIRGLAVRYAADRTLTGMTFGNAAGISKLLDQAGLFRLFEYLDKTGTVTLNDSERKLLSAVNIKSDADSFAKTLIDNINSLDFPEGIDMKLIIDNSGNILDRTLDTTVVDTRNKKSIRLGVHTGSTSILASDCRNRFIEVSVDGKDVSGKASRSVFKLSSAFTPSGNKGDENGKIDEAWSRETDGVLQSSTGIRLDLGAATDPLTLKRKDTCRYNVEMKYAGMDSSNILSGGIDTESWSNKKLKTRNWSTDATINASMPSFGVNDFTVALKLAGEDKLEIGTFELPSVNTSTTVDLNTATNEELGRVQDEILASFGVFYMTNKPIIDAVLGK